MMPASVSADDADLPARVDLAKKMVQILPARPQIESAVDSYIQSNLAGYTKQDRATFRQAMLNSINPKGLDKASVDAYATTYTKAELEVMVEYYAKPEAISAAKKEAEFAAKVYPELIKMLDQAVIRLRSSPKP
jgi:hypothetical protein